MNAALISNWNNRVGENDVVFHLGDFSFSYKKDENKKIFDQLKGKKILILGNHDPHQTTSIGWEAVHHYYEISNVIDGKDLILFHYPINSWNKMYHGSYHAFGHIHSKNAVNGNSCDVGVDAMNYQPISLEEFKERINNEN